MARVGLAVLALVVLDLVARAGLRGLTAPVVQVAPLVPAVLDRVAPADRMSPVVLGPVAPVALGPVARAVRAVQASPEAPAARIGMADLADQVGLVVPADRIGMADLAVPAVLVAPGDQMGPAARADLAARPQRRTCHAVLTTVAARSGVARVTRRTASARPVTVRRPRRRHMGSDGMVDLHRERRHRTGTGHRLPAAGTARRPPVAGTNTGMGRRAT